MQGNCTIILRNTKSDVQNLETYENVNKHKHSWILKTFFGGVYAKMYLGIEFYSSENCCYGYQIQVNKLLMPILFNFIVFSNTQNFLYFSEHGVVWS